MVFISYSERVCIDIVSADDTFALGKKIRKLQVFATFFFGYIFPWILIGNCIIVSFSAVFVMNCSG